MKKLLSLMLLFGFVVGMAAITGCGDEKKPSTPAKDTPAKDAPKDKK